MKSLKLKLSNPALLVKESPLQESSHLSEYCDCRGIIKGHIGFLT